MSSHCCGVIIWLERKVPSQVSSPSLDHGSKFPGSSPIEVSLKDTSQKREGIQRKHPCLIRDSNPDPMAPQSASLTTIPDGYHHTTIPNFLNDNYKEKRKGTTFRK
ncbi:hypothetical protein TNCV_1303561 [Trichonephila clavipes]|nr:hypothetical protein TNCV_1303561 [Trichonephila clavipes]